MILQPLQPVKSVTSHRMALARRLVVVSKILAFLIPLVAAFSGSECHAQNRGDDSSLKVEWRTGSDFTRQLQSEIGFTWQSTQDRAWMEKFERLKEYWRREGHSRIPTSYPQDPELG